MVFEELVLHEMATLSNAKLAGCPSTLQPDEGYLCRLCSRRDAICKVMVIMQNLQTDHPFCYACLDKGNEMFSKALGGASLQYVPLDTINYGAYSFTTLDYQSYCEISESVRIPVTPILKIPQNSGGLRQFATEQVRARRHILIASP